MSSKDLKESNNDDTEFGKKLGTAYEDEYIIGRWYIGHDSREADRVYVIKGRNPKDVDDWLVDEHHREGHYGYEDGWKKDVSLRKSRYSKHLTLLPEHIQSLGDKIRHSHAFWVRGHYRHLKSERFKNKQGQMIWIPPYIKGNGELLDKVYEMKKGVA